MPNTKSAKRALRQSVKRRSRNMRVKKAVKSVLKNYNSLVSNGSGDDVKDSLKTVYKALDKAAKKGIIAKNKSARLKSAAARKLKA